MKRGPLSDWTKSFPQATPLLRAAFEAVLAAAADLPPDGKLPVQGEDLFLMVQRYKTKPLEEGRYEAHRTYIDIQCVLSGEERLGVAPLDKLTETDAYNPASDAAFYARPARGEDLLTLTAGDFVLLEPRDGHMPGRHPGSTPVAITKIVAKVRADSSRAIAFQKPRTRRR